MGHSTEHAIQQLTDHITNSSEKNHFTVGVFIHLCKATDPVDHYISLAKLKKYGIKGNNLPWFENYLKNRKQNITSDDKTTAFADITWGIPRDSILRPLLLLIYVNNLPNVSKWSDSIMFPDDTNLFFSSNDNITLFSIVIIELEKISLWFIANSKEILYKKE